MSTTIQDIMRSPRLKVERANRHIEELRQRSHPLDRSLYEITNRKEHRSVIDNYPNIYRLSYKPTQDIPEVFASIIGDAIGNIRSAFDHLASKIVGALGKPAAGPLYFPITKRKDLTSHSGFAAIETALPNFQSLFLKEVRPENGPNERLWDFYTLNKDDKHNDFIPVVSVIEIKNINAMIGTNSLRDCRMGGDATRKFIFIESATPISIQDDFSTSVDVKFGQGTPFEYEPVVPTLMQISNLASGTLDWVESLIRTTRHIS